MKEQHTIKPAHQYSRSGCNTNPAEIGVRGLKLEAAMCRGRKTYKYTYMNGWVFTIQGSELAGIPCLTFR
eukprot:scaffold3662_cov388-Prasinococcus_capsulatus_cf.AAC.7